jgi:hypothetical protein
VGPDAADTATWAPGGTGLAAMWSPRPRLPATGMGDGQRPGRGTLSSGPPRHPADLPEPHASPRGVFCLIGTQPRAACFAARPRPVGHDPRPEVGPGLPRPPQNGRLGGPGQAVRGPCTAGPGRLERLAQRHGGEDQDDDQSGRRVDDELTHTGDPKRLPASIAGAWCDGPYRCVHGGRPAQAVPVARAETLRVSARVRWSEQIFYGELDGNRPKRVLIKVIGE